MDTTHTLENRQTGTCTSSVGEALFSSSAANRVGIRVVNTNTTGAIAIRKGNQTTEAYTVDVLPPRTAQDYAIGDAEALYVFAESAEAGTLSYVAFELIEAI